MASTFLRERSPFIWIRYKDASGKWKSMSTGYRQDNIGDRKQAALLAKRKSLEELISKPIKSSRSAWQEWVVGWIGSKWGDPAKLNSTANRYAKYFQRWLEFFEEKEIASPATFRREHIDEYFVWRERHGGGRNTAIHEIKFLAQVLEEALNRGYIATNPARRMRLSKDRPAEKIPWSDDEVSKVQAALEERDRYGWLHVTLLMGYHQAVRLRQAGIPLSCVDFKRRLINYPSASVKGGKGYSQPISPVFIETLKDIVRHRQKLGKSTLCDIPDHTKGQVPASVQWREFLDRLELHHLSHHGLRSAWITQAALRGIPESLAKRFVNHASTQVHEIYQKITATDLMPMLDAFLLAKPNALALPPATQAKA
jgi:site-specific recombinase XerD